jgi:hypothetical protein
MLNKMQSELPEEHRITTKKIRYLELKKIGSSNSNSYVILVTLSASCIIMK